MMGKRLGLLGAVIALACGLAANAFAEVRVEGDFNVLRVTASGDGLSDVLSALNVLPVKYRTAVPLNTEINGTYSGSFSQVVSRLLNGYSYVIKRDQTAVEIVVLGQGGQAAVAPRSAEASKGVMSRWR
jgi:hypothetical protein